MNTCLTTNVYNSLNKFYYVIQSPEHPRVSKELKNKTSRNYIYEYQKGETESIRRLLK